MKKSTKSLLLAIVTILVVVLGAYFIFNNQADEVKTSTFKEKMGIVYVYEISDENISLSTDQQLTQQVLEIDGYFVRVDKDYKVQNDEQVIVVGLNKYLVSAKKAVIKTVEIDGYTIKGFNSKGRANYESSFGREDNFVDLLDALVGSDVINNYNYLNPNRNSFWESLILPGFMGLIGIVLFFVLMRQMGGGGKGINDFGKSKVTPNHTVKVRFTDIAGAEEEKEELKEIVEFLKNPKKFTDVGARIPRGVLLVGPPGTGKTLFAKAVAGEANVPFFSISGSDFVEMFVGVGASRVRDMFATAKKNMPCIVFIDEIDAVGRQRGTGLGGGNDEREQTLNQLLVQMDGFETNDGIIIMAATNRADILDPALLRPGRFDRQIYVNLPDVRGREAILRVHARNKPLARDVNFKTIAKITTGYSGADLANLLNEAAILAARENSPAITNNHLYEANNKVTMGPKKKSRYVSEKDKKLTAYHEAGHALLVKLMPDFFPVQEVTIIPRGRAGGYTLFRPEDDMPYYNKKFLISDITVCLGGRIAEEVVFDEISSGARGDIMQATNMARKMVTEWGMSEEIGLINYGDNDQVFLGRDYQTRATYSEDTAKRIDQEVSRIIKDCYKKGVELIKENISYLEVMAKLLLEKETIFKEEVDMIMQGKTLEEILADMDERDRQRAENPFGEKRETATEVENTEKTDDTNNQ